MRLAFFIFIALLVGCAALPGRPPSADPEADWKARQALLAQIDTWDLRGRVALRNAGEGVQASLQWTREADRQRIDLSGPFGGGRVRLTQGKDGAELRDTDDRVYRDSSVQRLLLRRIGWDLPIQGLHYWVLGLPAPEAITRSELDQWGRLKTLEQSGWEVRFLEYAQQGRFELPSRVFVRRADSLSMPVEARLVIEKWTLPGVNP